MFIYATAVLRTQLEEDKKRGNIYSSFVDELQQAIEVLKKAGEE